MGFQTRKNEDGTTTVLDVPIFPECERGDDKYTKARIKKMFDRLRQAKDEGHLIPVHIHHTGERDNKVDVGMFDPGRIGPLSWRGTDHECIFGDLILTDDDSAEMMRKQRLRYRSVELSDDNPENVVEISSLALTNNPPFAEMPMTFIDGDVATETTRTVTYTKARSTDRPVLCFKRDGRSTTVYMEATMPDPKLFQADEKKDDDDEDKKMEKDGEEVLPGFKMEDGGSDEGGESEGDSNAGPDVAAICKALSSGDIALSDFAEVRTAMSDAEAMAAGDTGEADMIEEEAPPEPSDNPPDVVQMQKDAAKDAKLFTADNRIAALENKNERDSAITGAVETLAPYAVSGDPRKKITEQYEKGSANGGGHKMGMARLKHFVEFAQDGGSPLAPGKFDTEGAPVSDLPDDVKELLTGDPSHDEAVSIAHTQFSRLSGRFKQTTFPQYWKANANHFAKSPLQAVEGA